MEPTLKNSKKGKIKDNVKGAAEVLDVLTLRLSRGSKY